MILHNGKIATQDDRRSVVESAAIRDGKFLAAGSDREVMLTVRIAYNLFTRKPKGKLADFQNWSGNNGAGDMLVFSAGGFRGLIRALTEANGRVSGADGAAARIRRNRTTLLARMNKLGIDPHDFT